MLKHDAQPDRPVSFGYKCSWLAIKSEHPLDVIDALDLLHVRRASWKAGIEAAYAGAVFISPPIDSWILVVSGDLPWPGGERHGDPCTPLLVHLGQRFPEVQFFATHRVVETHAWARVVNGAIQRQYAYSGESGEILWDYGSPTWEEVELLRKQQESLQSVWEPDDDDEDDVIDEVRSDTPFLMPRESDVMHMAALWSVDPSQLEERDLGKSLGYLGEFRQ